MLINNARRCTEGRARVCESSIGGPPSQAPSRASCPRRRSAARPPASTSRFVRMMYPSCSRRHLLMCCPAASTHTRPCICLPRVSPRQSNERVLARASSRGLNQSRTIEVRTVLFPCQTALTISPGSAARAWPPHKAPARTPTVQGRTRRTSCEGTTPRAAAAARWTTTGASTQRAPQRVLEYIQQR